MTHLTRRQCLAGLGFGGLLGRANGPFGHDNAARPLGLES